GLRYDKASGLTFYQVGNKLTALSPQLCCLYVGTKANGHVTYEKRFLQESPANRQDRIYVDKAVLAGLGLQAQFDVPNKTVRIALEDGGYQLPQTSFASEELYRLIAADVAQEKDKKEGLLARYTTSFNAGNRNRTTNLRLAATAINGTVIPAGGSFSFNNTVGPRTSRRGYKMAIIYSAGKEIDGLGGGICQVSSTLYNTVLAASLKVTQRHTHSLPVSYVPKGRDATVSYGALDFRFQNNRSYPVTIKATINGGRLTVDLWGK
ncbi:MAG: VanW family protein, partial [Clostridiales bacterium]